MKRVLLFLSILFLFSAAKAQKVYFIYLQSESNAPFFVKMARQVYSSTASGYLILSNLKDSTYNISLGFPSSKEDELKFTLSVNHADKGYLLKKFDDGLALFDLQELTIIKPIPTVSNGTAQKTIKREDSFTKLLAQAADDESLLTEVVYEEKKEPAKTVTENSVQDVVAQPAIIKEEKNKEITVKEIVQEPNTDQAKTETKPMSPDSSLTTNAGNVQKDLKEVKEAIKTKEEEIIPQDQKIVEAAVVKTQPIGEQNTIVENKEKEDVSQQEPAKKENAISSEPISEYKRSLVTKRSESSTTEGFGLVFLDKEDDVTDTIRLLIPNPKIQLVNQSSEIRKEEVSLADAEKTTIREETSGEEKSVATPEENKKKETTRTKKNTPVKEERNDNKNKPLFGSRKKDDNSTEQPELKQREEATRKEKPLLSIKKKDKDQDEAPSVVTESRLSDVQPDGSKPAETISNNKVSCKSTASENDFLKLRKNMASEAGEEDMIDAARKFYRSKCFSTEQVKNLGALFLTEENKYNFYDLSYKYVHDREQFRSLAAELKEDYYIKRFKALIGE